MSDAMQIGVDNFHFAPLTKDDATSFTYGSIVAVPGLSEITITPETTNATFYADNGAYAVATGLGKVTVEISLADIPLEVQAALLGHTLNAGIMVKKSTDSAPYVAVLCRTLKSNGKYRYLELTKGKFELVTDTAKTKGESISLEAQKIKGTFIPRINDKEWMRSADEDVTGYLPETGTAWFTTVG